MIKRQGAKPILEPISLIYKGKKIELLAKLKAPIKKISNGGARISLSKDYITKEAIILIIEKEKLK